MIISRKYNDSVRQQQCVRFSLTTILEQCVPDDYVTENNGWLTVNEL